MESCFLCLLLSGVLSLIVIIMLLIVNRYHAYASSYIYVLSTLILYVFKKYQCLFAQFYSGTQEYLMGGFSLCL